MLPRPPSARPELLPVSFQHALSPSCLHCICPHTHTHTQRTHTTHAHTPPPPQPTTTHTPTHTPTHPHTHTHTHTHTQTHTHIKEIHHLTLPMQGVHSLRYTKPSHRQSIKNFYFCT